MVTMTARQATSSNHNAIVFMLAAVVIVVVLALAASAAAVPGSPQVITVPDVGPVILGDHAVQRHGSDAEAVREAVQTGGPGSHWQCRDGKEYIAKPLDGGGWGLMIIRNGYEVSSFPTTLEYIQRVIEEDGCSNPWRYAHP